MREDRDFVYLDGVTGLSLKELRALSECRLTVPEQERMSDLLDRNSNGQLSIEEKSELEALVDQADQLSLLKTRAQYTAVSVSGMS